MFVSGTFFDIRRYSPVLCGFWFWFPVHGGFWFWVPVHGGFRFWVPVHGGFRFWVLMHGGFGVWFLMHGVWGCGVAAWGNGTRLRSRLVPARKLKLAQRVVQVSQNTKHREHFS